MKTIKHYFEYALTHGASDLHLVGDEVPMIRVAGELQSSEEKPLAPAELKTQIYTLLSSAQKKKYEEALELDFGYEFEGSRFRINLHQQDGKIGMSARLIPKNIPTPEELKFNETILSFAQLLDGLVLIVGPTGHGKSTTIASLIEEINKTRKAHIVTIEDPVEFVFTDKMSLVEQREVGTDTHSFAEALKHVLRQDPNVIFVGEMRDPETIATVLTAAETGHLVFSTLHSSSVAEAIERIVDVFDGSKQKQILIQLSGVLRGVVAQQLIPAVDGTRVAAREILINTSAVAHIIRENNTAQIGSVLQTGLKEGMLPMDKAVEQLYKADIISQEVAEKRIGRQRKI